MPVPSSYLGHSPIHASCRAERSHRAPISATASRIGLGLRCAISCRRCSARERLVQLTRAIEVTLHLLDRIGDMSLHVRVLRLGLCALQKLQHLLMPCDLRVHECRIERSALERAELFHHLRVRLLQLGYDSTSAAYDSCTCWPARVRARARAVLSGRAQLRELDIRSLCQLPILLQRFRVRLHELASERFHASVACLPLSELTVLYFALIDDREHVQDLRIAACDRHRIAGAASG